MKKIFVQFALIVLSAVLPQSVSSHDFWIEPDRFVLESPGDVKLTLREGVDLKGNSLPYITEWFEDFSQTDASGRSNIVSVLGNNPAATISLKDGVTLVGYQSQRSFVDLGPEKFASYLRDEGMDFVFDLREERGEADQNALEYFVRCAKSFLYTAGSESSDTFSTQLGYTLELIPESDPYEVTAGGDFAIRLLYLGEPLEGTLVRAFTKDLLDEPIDARTDADGRVVLTLSRPGEWLVKAVHLIPIENDPKARWESFWASITFALE